MTKTTLYNKLSKNMNVAPKSFCAWKAEINDMIFVGGKGKNWIVECDTKNQVNNIKKVIKGNDYWIKEKGNGRFVIKSLYRHWK